MCRERTLWIGDAVVLILVTAAGFFTHGTQAHVGRMALTATLTVGTWFLAAWPLNLMRFPQARQGFWWLRLVWAAALATPLALTLRAWILMQPLAPLFAPAAFAFNALGVFLWRLLVAWRCPVQG